MNCEAQSVRSAVAAIILAVAGAALHPACPAPAGERRDADAAVTAGTRILLPGGLRTLAADLLWLKAYLAWAVGDVAGTRRLLQTVTAVDGRPRYFWLNGARIMAFDMVQWRLRAGGAGPAPAAVRRRVVEEQAGAALQFLEEARRRGHDGATVRVEMANIHLYALGDVAGAAEWYRRASESPDAPPCAARIHAELLRRLGRHREAYAWLRWLHPRLAPGDERAMADVVLARIRELEVTLGVSNSERYVPGRPGGDGAATPSSRSDGGALCWPAERRPSCGGFPAPRRGRRGSNRV